MCYGGCAQGTLCPLGSWNPGLLTCVTAATFRLVATSGGSIIPRAPPWSSRPPIPPSFHSRPINLCFITQASPNMSMATPWLFVVTRSCQRRRSFGGGRSGNGADGCTARAGRPLVLPIDVEKEIDHGGNHSNLQCAGRGVRVG